MSDQKNSRDNKSRKVEGSTKPKEPKDPIPTTLQRRQSNKRNKSKE